MHEFNEQILTEIWLSVFPESHAEASIGKFANGLFLKGYLQKPEEWIKGIAQNDPLSFFCVIEKNGTYVEHFCSLDCKAENPANRFKVLSFKTVIINQVTRTELTSRFELIRKFIIENESKWHIDVSEKVQENSFQSV